jgi:two-component system nitrogen regulation sensor histidine kinase NtrY
LSTSGKIRLLLALLFATLLLTAGIVQSTYTPVKNLDQTAKTLENNLHKKESYINAVISSPASFERLKKLQDNPQAALQAITDFTTNRGIWFVTYTADTLSFWSGIKIIPATTADIKEGVSFIKGLNGYYEAIKKSKGNFSAIYFIPIKINYLFQNQYLQNKFAKDLLDEDNIGMAGFFDTGTYGIHSSIDNSYLFSVKLIPGKVNRSFFYFELVSWLLTSLALCILIHAICKYFVSKGHVVLSLVVLAAFIVGSRYINLH